MNDLFNIKDYVVVITGGTGVLGRTIAKYLAVNGAQVVILGRKEEVGKEIIDDIVKDGGKAEFMKTDVMDYAAVQKNCDDIMAKYGRIDTLLNAAGGNMPGATIAPDQTFFNLKVESNTPMPWAWNHADSYSVICEQINKLFTGDYAVEDFARDTDEMMAEILASDQ